MKTMTILKRLSGYLIEMEMALSQQILLTVFDEWKSSDSDTDTDE